VVAWRRDAGRDEDGAELVAIEVSDVGLVVDAWPADVHRWRAVDDAFFLGVAVTPDHRAEPAGHGGACLPAVLEVPGERLDVDAPDLEEVLIVLRAPGGELPKVEGVRLAGEAAVARQRASTAVRCAGSVPRRVVVSYCGALR
jgi:hypothetical protein